GYRSSPVVRAQRDGSEPATSTRLFCRESGKETLGKPYLMEKRESTRDGIATSRQILSPLKPIVKPTPFAEARTWKHCWN
ncbi:hypothetical protein GOODEAATRI_028668, partial [Goodea atripinnis]